MSMFEHTQQCSETLNFLSPKTSYLIIPLFELLTIKSTLSTLTFEVKLLKIIQLVSSYYYKN